MTPPHTTRWTAARLECRPEHWTDFWHPGEPGDLLSESVGEKRLRNRNNGADTERSDGGGLGNNDSGQTTVPAGLSNVVALTAGWSHSLALKSNGTVVAWGYNDSGQTTVPAGVNNVVAIAAGWSHSLALRSAGTVVGWGYNGNGQRQFRRD